MDPEGAEKKTTIHIERNLLCFYIQLDIQTVSKLQFREVFLYFIFCEKNTYIFFLPRNLGKYKKTRGF